MAEVDRLMVEEFGIQLVQMMENAGRSLAEQARRMLGGRLAGQPIVVLCGAGNNGGGGMVAARHLHNWGADVRVILAAEPNALKAVPRQQWQILRAMGVPGTVPGAHSAASAELIVDALIGYGLRGDPRGVVADWIRWANRAQSRILALDTPSGLDTTTGSAASPCIRAGATLTLALPKTGLLAPEAKAYVGDLYVADISVPPQLYRRLGLDVGPLFAESSIIKLAEL
jgi:NAD(P)H-hydrate epimerase